MFSAATGILANHKADDATTGFASVSIRAVFVRGIPDGLERVARPAPASQNVKPTSDR